MKYFKFKYTREHEEEQKSIANNSVYKCLIGVLNKLIPKANPDFEQKYNNVSTWYIEYDDDKQFTSKEIGLNEKGKVIVKAPYKKNLGLWVDSCLQYEDYLSFDVIPIKKEEFMVLWDIPLVI
ncbi:MAG: hypothetical protein IKX44_08300 [Prevotella sp.]|nr:hypothetical protein [Prevotella sp.]